MGVIDKPKKRGGTVTQMNGLKNSHLMMEVSILRENLSLNDQGERDRYKQSGKFKIWKGVLNPTTPKYLVQHVWGFSNSYLFELDKRMKNILSSLNADTSD